MIEADAKCPAADETQQSERPVRASTRVLVAKLWDADEESRQDLSVEERRRAAAFRSSRRRQQFVCGRLLLRAALSGQSARSPGKHQLIVEASGKLRCAGGPAVCISHDKYTVACVVSDLPMIGIDMETPARRRRSQDIARAFFSAHEADWLASQPEARFFQLWTLKEAYAKATGLGVFGGLNRFSGTIDGERICVHDDADQVGQLALFGDGSRYLSLAAPGLDADAIEILSWSPATASAAPDRTFRLLART